MVGDLLEFSRLDLGQVNFCPEMVSVKYLYQDVLAGYRNTGREIIIKPFSEEICAWADPLRLQQIIQNILDNALKHTPAGTTITLDCRQQGETICVVIADNGPGINPEILINLFEPFQNGGRKPGSYGLGMAITKRLVKGMKGNISVESTPGQGSIFIVELPFLKI